MLKAFFSGLVCCCLLASCSSDVQHADEAADTAEMQEPTDEQPMAEVDMASATEPSPSAGAMGMAGALGTFRFTPEDWTGTEEHPNPPGPSTLWLDSDGVDPGTAGCHMEVTEEGATTGRMFGEACLPDGMLVESNPGAGETHLHQNDVGNPDKFDCNAWCKGNGSESGVCEAAPAPPCEASAKCVCT